jgi:PHD/YefM family antitoxin component YafN of YafNO toxin-antitoxin module
MMIKGSEFNISKGPKANKSQAGPGGDTSMPLTPGVWQKEALDTIKMYAPDEGKFSPVHKQLTLFPMDEVSEAKPVQTVNLDDPDISVPHWGSFRFYGTDAQRLVLPPVAKPAPTAEAPSKVEHPKDVVSATNGQLILDGVTQMKADDFPGRIKYTEGGLYPPGDGSKKEVRAQHQHAPNYRKMPNKPVHGVGQPTKQGFKDVLNHLGAKDKPIVWTNTRAEAVMYINGSPYNLRQLASMENLDLKAGATGAEIEALEEKLKQRLIDKKSIQVPIEGAGPNEPKFKTVELTSDNVQTTKDVIDELRQDGYQVEYKRIPLTDEKSPSAAQIDEIRQWTNEAQAKHPDAKLEYVFNCHQGRGRTTTGMVAAGIALDGRTKQLELPFGFKLGEDAQGRADRIIDENFHVQNLRETVDETKDKAAKQDQLARELDKKAARESDLEKKKALERQAQEAREKKATYETRATDFTQRYALMQKYSEYIDQFGAKSKDPSFDQWMKDEVQVKDLGQKWASLNTQLGLPARPALAYA